MLVLLAMTIILAVPVTTGLINSRRQRNLDRRHFAAFLGFCAAFTGVVATILLFSATIAWFRPPRDAYDHPTQAAITAILSFVGFYSSLAAAVSGLVSRGRQRLSLVGFGVSMGLIYVFGAVVNFGN